MTDVAADGIAHGSLEPGDVLVSAGGHLITTEPGSRRFHFAGDSAVRLVVRRADRRMSFDLLPIARCPEPRRATDDTPLRVAGLIGLHLRCERCALDREGSVLVWRFETAPVVVEVVPGTPAATAGIRVGDRLLEIDGEPLTEPGGARRFSRLAPDTVAVLRVLRDGRLRRIDMRIGPGTPR